MLTIQQVGSEILNNTPRKFYAFLGTEYGIKSRYIDILRAHYSDSVFECASVFDVLNMMNTKRLIPLKPSLYIVRYDDEFVSSLSESSSKKISSTNIVGTLVCIYENEKPCSKVAKYLPDYSVSIDGVSKQFIYKYLKSEFSSIPDDLLQVISSRCINYSNGRLVCRSLVNLGDESLRQLSQLDVEKLFNLDTSYGDAKIRKGIASRNFVYMFKMFEDYENDNDGFLYTILYVVTELEKVLTNPTLDSDIKEYARRWTKQSLYNMYMQTYNCIKMLRSYTSSSSEIIYYLMSLMQFKEVPSVEEMS